MKNMAVVEALRLQVLAGAALEFERGGFETRGEKGESLDEAAAAPMEELEYGVLGDEVRNRVLPERPDLKPRVRGHPAAPREDNGRASPSVEEIKTVGTLGCVVQYCRLDVEDEARSLDEAEHDYFPDQLGKLVDELREATEVMELFCVQMSSDISGSVSAGVEPGLAELEATEVDAGRLSQCWALLPPAHPPRGDLDVASLGGENEGAGCVVLDQRRPPSEAEVQVGAGGLSRRWALESLSHCPRGDRKSTRLNSSHTATSRMPSSA